MQKTLYLVFFLITGLSYAETFHFYNHSIFTDRAVMILTNQQENYWAKLDCQSFFQKFDLYLFNPGNNQSEMIIEKYITINECEELWVNSLNDLQRNGEVCVELDESTASPRLCQE